MFNTYDKLYKKIFEEKRSKEELDKKKMLGDMVMNFYKKVFNKINLPKQHLSFGYIDEFGYYVLYDCDRGMIDFLEGFPCRCLEQAFKIIIMDLLFYESMNYELENRKKLIKDFSTRNKKIKYNSMLARYEYTLRLFDKYYDGIIPDDIIKTYEKKLDYSELDNINHKYNNKTKEIDLIVNNKIRIEKLEELKKYLEELQTTQIERREITKPFITSTGYNCYLNNGMVLQREKISKNGNDGSSSIIIPEVNGEYLTVIEPRVFTYLRAAVGFPAGYIEYNENPELAALRELREETGYVPERLIELDSYYQDEGISSAYNHIFYANNCKKQYDQNLDEGEVIRYMLFNYDELLELERMGYINGANSKLALTKIKKIKE